MAKQSGLLTTVSIDDSGGTARDISAAIQSVTVSTPRGSSDITGLDKAAVERILMMSDGQVTLNGTFDKAANKQHDVFKTMSNSDVTRTFTIDYGDLGAAPASGDPRLEMEMLITSYEVQRPTDGTLQWSATLQLQSGTAPAWTTKP